jgi:hypothetical protein
MKACTSARMRGCSTAISRWPPRSKRLSRGTGNGSRRELRIAVELQRVIRGMKDQRGRANGGNAPVGHGRAVVQFDPGVARLGRVHEVDDLVHDLPLPGREPGDDLVAGTHEVHERLAQRGTDAPVGDVVLEDHLQPVARAVRLGLLRIGGRRHAA